MEIIINAIPLTRLEAFNKNKKEVLLYKNRICEYCKKTFDIMEKGILYWCGCEKDERN